MASGLTRDQIAAYHEDGFIFVRGLFDAEETGLLRRAMEEDPAIQQHSLPARRPRRGVRPAYPCGTEPATASTDWLRAAPASSMPQRR